MAEPKDGLDDEGVEDAWAEALAEQQNGEGSGDGGSEFQSSPLSELVAAGNGGGEGEGEEPVDLDMVLDIPVTISMEIGRTQISIRNLLKLNQGSVVELDRLAGEPLDVLVNGTLIAHGEVVVVNEKFGIRLTDVITAMERIKKLQ